VIMAKAKTAANAFIDLVTPNKPKTSPLNAIREASGEEPLKTITAAQRAAAGRAAAAQIVAQPELPMSEALGNLNAEGKRLVATQADRTRVGGGNIGGPGFSAMSLADPNYADMVWGVGSKSAASGLINQNDPRTIWTTLLGSQTQLKTNPIVFAKLEKEFRQAMKDGKLSPELEAKINHNLALTLGEGADIRDPNIWKEADSFDRRAALSDIMIGEGIPPKKGGVALGGAKSGKGVIFDPLSILTRETEPSLRGDVPTFAFGPRLFTMNGETSFRPDLHPGFPMLLHGEDLGVKVRPVPNEIALPDYRAEFARRNAEFARLNPQSPRDPNRNPSYYDLTKGFKGEGLPSQNITEEWLTHLQKHGNADGGIIRKADGGMVDSVPEEAIKNTVRDPQAARLLDLDLAKYALMNQPQRMGGGGAMKKIAKAATKPAALSQAEKDANLKQWMSSGKIKTDEGDPLRLYHATPKDFDQFKAGGNDPTMSGVATWLTDNPEYQPAAHNIGGGQRGFKEGTNVMPVYSNASRPLLIDDPQMQQWANDVFAGGKGELPYMVSPNTAKAIKEAGYDYIHYADPHKSNEPHEYIMLDPERQIKSAIGNRGTYDPNEPSITKAHGGAVRMAQGGQVLSEAIGGQVQTPVQGDMGKMTFDQYRTSIGMHEGGRHMANGGQVQRFDEGGQASLDQMRYELANSPVMQATPRNPVQDWIGTFGGYMDKAGKFISESIEPTAEKHPVKNFLANMFLADPLKGAGTLMQDLTGTVRETDEDNPVRGIIDKNWKNLSNGTEPLLDPRVLDIAQFGGPAAKAATKVVRTGAKAITPFAKSAAEMAAELYGRGQMPGMVAPNAFMVEPSAPKPAKALAPANEQGFYSPTEAAALNLQRKSGNGQAFLNDIMKGENVRSEEISGMGLDTWLKDKKNVTAAEVQDYIAQNKLGLGETLYGAVKEDPVGMANRKEIFDFYQPEIDRLYKKHDAYFDAGDNASRRKVEDQIINVQLKRNAEANSAYEIPNSKPTKFEEHALPGGENYREVVITMPDPKDALMDQIKALGITKNKTDRISVNDILQRGGSDELAESWKKAMTDPYRSSHFDEPNVLAHLRMSDRVTDGKKTLLVDEVQSDWHQAGREQGYGPTMEKSVEAYYETKDGQRIPIGFGKTKEEAEANIDVGWKNMVDIKYETHERKVKEGVPNAPYKDDWYQLALRRAVKEAIDGGYDRVALPTGARVADRFKLTNHVDEIVYGKNGDIYFYKNRDSVKSLNGKKPEELGAIVGKEVAKKLLDSEPNKYGARTLSGVDLEVGGEGMKKYYDEIYPTYLKKFGKKYGAGVGKTTVDVEGAAEPLHYMDITPAMRKEFSTGIHMAKGGKVSFAKSADDMRKELLRNKHG